MYHWDGELKTYRREALKTAKELCYPQLVLDKIKNAKTYNEISNIMADARHNSN